MGSVATVLAFARLSTILGHCFNHMIKTPENDLSFFLRETSKYIAVHIIIKIIKTVAFDSSFICKRKNSESSIVRVIAPFN
jgi:hypothetical protein